MVVNLLRPYLTKEGMRSFHEDLQQLLADARQN